MTTTLPPSGDTPAELAEHLASGARLVEAFHLMPGVARAMREAARLLRKPCTCHPDDSPPFPCPQKYALSECRAVAAPPAVQQQAEPAAFPGGPRMGSALQKLGARLADMLDDDQWNNIEPMLLDVHAEAAPPAVQAEPVMTAPLPPLHTEESLMALALSIQEGNGGMSALRLAIREVLAERDSFYMDYRMKCDEQSKAALVRAEKAEAECERLRELIAELDGHEGAEGWSEGMRERIDAALKEQP